MQLIKYIYTASIKILKCILNKYSIKNLRKHKFKRRLIYVFLILNFIKYTAFFRIKLSNIVQTLKFHNCQIYSIDFISRASFRKRTREHRFTTAVYVVVTEY